jgi:hypothetical protein
VDERSPEQIAAAVSRLLTDGVLASAVREAGYSHAISGFSRIQSARRIDAIYRSALGQ